MKFNLITSMRLRLAAAYLLPFMFACTAVAQDINVAQRLQGFDAYMAKTLKDWNAPGVGVGIVVNDKLVFAKGYGYRDYEKKLPFTAGTVIPIGSNTKLFTAVAAGMLVEEGKLTWDKPVRESVPIVHFYNEELNNTVTLRDMLSHRTGITRHDFVWIQSGLSLKELFEKLVYLEPQAPIRSTFLYNNLMVASVGYLIELQSGKTWEQLVSEKILIPLQMNSTSYTIADMLKQPQFGVGFAERRDSYELYRIPYYEEKGLAPAGAIVSNIEDMSHWLIALMNQGQYQGRQVLPATVLKETLQPAIADPEESYESRGWFEILNPAYGMGRDVASYRGHLLTFHGGAVQGFYTQISFMPQDHIGVIVFEIGEHSRQLYDIVSYNVYERLLGMSQTPWSERLLGDRLKNKKEGTLALTKAEEGRVADTKPSHPLSDYAGAYENPAYGVITVDLKDNQLAFNFHGIQSPLTHFHYDRFDTPYDELHNTKFSVNFRTDPQGNIDEAVMSLDEKEAVFARRPETIDPKLMSQLAGEYTMPNGAKIQVTREADGVLSILVPDRPAVSLVQIKGLTFRTPLFSDLTFEFVVQGGEVKALRQRSPTGVFTYPRM